MKHITRREEIINKRFGKILVVDTILSKNYGIICVCNCDCGNEINLYPSQLKTRKDCGCVPVNTKHGYSRTNEYSIWNAMMRRCYNENNFAYKNYGGRGILVCERWHIVGNFINDMGVRPSKNHSIDRIDNNGNYCPENCRWVTQKEQCRNKRTNIIITIKGETNTLSYWCDFFKINRSVIIGRIRNGVLPEDSFFKPVRLVNKNRKFYVNGKNMTVKEMSIYLGIPKGTVETRLSRGWSLDKIINTK